MVKDLQRRFEYYRESIPGGQGITIYFHTIRDKETGENICRMHDEEAARLMAQAPELLRDAMAFRKLKSLAIQHGEINIRCDNMIPEFPWSMRTHFAGCDDSNYEEGKTIHEALEGLSE